MNLCLHHNSESGCASASAKESLVSEEFFPQPVPTLPPFSGRLFDITSGLQNNQIRWQDPTIGRWISEDPVGYAGENENLTRYVGQ